MRKASLLSLIVLLACSAVARGADWAESLFDETSHNFGNVPRGIQVRHVFKITNRLAQPVHIAKLDKTCGCASAVAAKDTLQPGESTELEAVMDTTKFVAHKDSNVIVDFDQPFIARVYLRIVAEIRQDVVMNPGRVDFGTVAKGTAPTRTLDVDYAGRNDWTIKEVKNPNESLTADLKETRRGDGRVGYRLTVHLKPETSTGNHKGELTLITDDPASPKIPVTVQAKIEPDIKLSTNSLFLGTVRPGQTVAQKLLVQGKKPFHISKIEADSSAFELIAPAEAKPLHILTVTFRAPDKASGVLKARCRLETDVKGEAPLEFEAYAQVSP